MKGDSENDESLSRNDAPRQICLHPPMNGIFSRDEIFHDFNGRDDRSEENRNYPALD
jgi:hypothetical protein